jgi:hypothetical protein
MDDRVKREREQTEGGTRMREGVERRDTKEENWIHTTLHVAGTIPSVHPFIGGVWIVRHDSS